MLIAKIENGKIAQMGEHRELFPQVSFTSEGPTSEFLNEYCCLAVNLYKPYDRDTQYIQTTAPYIEGNEVFLSEVMKLDQSTVDSLRADRISSMHEVYASDVKCHLDKFVQTRKYDSMLAAVSYAQSTVEQFKVEALRAIELRDSTWAKFNEIMSDIEHGTLPIPESFDTIKDDLPTLSW